MQKQKKQMIVLVILLILLILAYIGVHFYSKKQEEKENAKEEAEKIVEALRKCPYSKDAAIIGEVTEDQPGKVVMTTEIGTQALLPQPGGELLPRIC